MGTHPNSPSHLSVSDAPLKEHLAAHPELMGPGIITKFNAADGDVPFLFKVLSIRKALSIQTHPDKKTAEKLHALQPHIYKGSRHNHDLAGCFANSRFQMTTTSRRWQLQSHRSRPCAGFCPFPRLLPT
jgi:mannose-6-phosphate isomerase class I